MASGYVKLAKKIKDNEHYQDANTIRLFIHLLITVNFETSEWRGVEINAGERVCSQETLAKELGLTAKQIRSSLDKLIASENVKKRTIPIEARNRSRNRARNEAQNEARNDKRQISIVSIVNWAQYQGGGRETRRENGRETGRETGQGYKKLINKADGSGERSDGASRLPIITAPDDWDGEF